MIEVDVMQYLRGLPVFGVLAASIYAMQAPKDAKMPFMIVEIPGGSNPRAGQSTEEKGIVRITVDCGIAQMGTGRTFIQNAWDALHEYRGLLGTSNDIYITSGVPRGWAGLNDTYRYMFESDYKFIKALNSPT